MQTPAFFDEVPPIVVADPLAALLGAAVGGRVALARAKLGNSSSTHSPPMAEPARLMLPP